MSRTIYEQYGIFQVKPSTSSRITYDDLMDASRYTHAAVREWTNFHTQVVPCVDWTIDEKSAHRLIRDLQELNEIRTFMSRNPEVGMEYSKYMMWKNLTA